MSLRKLRLAFLFFICIVIGIGSPFAFAQESGLIDGETFGTNPKDRPVTVTAGVVDITPPSIPILIAPENNSYVTVSRPSFIWEESTDNMVMSHYHFYLDGNVLFSDIPLTATDATQYTLTKDGTRYTLVPKDSISDGIHTWKIQAVDGNDNSRDSATWSFTLDTTAPVFLISQIGEEVVTISAQDPTTHPDEPIEIDTNEPEISGTTEANSTVQLTVEISGGGTQTYTSTADSSGNWSFTLPILPRETIITMDFQITDPAGNLTILNDIQFIINQIFLFPSATPVSSDQPTPSQTPIASVTPTWPGAGFFPSIPVIPPKELLNALFSLVIPQQLIDAIPQVVEDSLSFIAPVGSAIVAGALPATATLTLASQFGWSLSLEMIIRILQALGLLPRSRPQGVVFNSTSGKPVPFALLTIHKTGDQSIKETLVTTVDGIYGGITLSQGKYSIDVRHQDFLFPTEKDRPNYLTMLEYYKGEEFVVKEEKQPQLFMIPVDPLQKEDDQQKNRISKQLIQIRLTNFMSALTIPMFLLTMVIVMYVPTIFNWIVFLLYCAIVVVKIIKSFKIPRIRGKVVDASGAPLPDVFVRVIAKQTNQLAALLITNHNGEFKAYIPKDVYQIALTKQDYIWVENGAPQTFYELDTMTKRASIVAVMDDVSKIYKELFG